MTATTVDSSLEPVGALLASGTTRQVFLTNDPEWIIKIGSERENVKEARNYEEGRFPESEGFRVAACFIDPLDPCKLYMERVFGATCAALDIEIPERAKELWGDLSYDLWEMNVMFDGKDYWLVDYSR